MKKMLDNFPPLLLTKPCSQEAARCDGTCFGHDYYASAAADHGRGFFRAGESRDRMEGEPLHLFLWGGLNVDDPAAGHWAQDAVANRRSGRGGGRRREGVPAAATGSTVVQYRRLQPRSESAAAAGGGTGDGTDAGATPATGTGWEGAALLYSGWIVGAVSSRAGVSRGVCSGPQPERMGCRIGPW